MPLKKVNIFAACALLFLIVALCFANGLCAEGFNSDFVQTNEAGSEESVPDSLSAMPIPKACFLPDEKNFSPGRNDVYVLNKIICGIINLMFIAIYLLYSSQVKDKHTERGVVLLI